jgi:hypothetical protein
VSTSSGSITMHEPRVSRPGRRAIAAVVLVVAFGTGILVGRSGEMNNAGSSGLEIKTHFPTAKELRDPVAILHRRIYSHFPELVEPAPLDLEP